MYVFIVSRNARPLLRRVLWQVQREEAKRICSDPRTASASYMLCWTSDPGTAGKDWTWVADNGMHDQVLRDLGIVPDCEMERV
ncbi:hypothetical protein ABZ714_13115 [Streptomyces sp. NPDC006798]|uniref:hypothetical protein n=1 Tax=Streptomyces sp. NPDC006798 TaxID=3155462 RepID=UPI0033E707BA